MQKFFYFLSGVLLAFAFSPIYGQVLDFINPLPVATSTPQDILQAQIFTQNTDLNFQENEILGQILQLKAICKR